eukprot:1139382_1
MQTLIPLTCTIRDRIAYELYYIQYTSFASFHCFIHRMDIDLCALLFCISHRFVHDSSIHCLLDRSSRLPIMANIRYVLLYPGCSQCSLLTKPKTLSTVFDWKFLLQLVAKQNPIELKD